MEILLRSSRPLCNVCGNGWWIDVSGDHAMWGWSVVRPLFDVPHNLYSGVWKESKQKNWEILTYILKQEFPFSYFGEPFLDPRAIKMNQFLICTHDCLNWSLAGSLLIHDGVLLYWIVSLPLHYPPLLPPLCSQQLYNHFIVRRAGCLVFSNSIYPARVKISISLQCSNVQSLHLSYNLGIMVAVWENIGNIEHRITLCYFYNCVKHDLHDYKLELKLLTQFTEFTLIFFFWFCLVDFRLSSAGHQSAWTRFLMNLMANSLNAKLLI